jgi:hypothetical protein
MKKILLALLALILADSTCALSIGAGPSSLEFLNVNKGGHAEKTLAVYTDSEENLVVKVDATGAISEWLTLNETRFILPAGGRKEIQASVDPPVATPNGLYNGKIHFYAALEKEVGNREDFPVKGGTSILATVKVTGEQKYSYSIDSVSVRDVEAGYPIKVDVSVTNDGNIKAVPQFTLKVLDELREKTMLEENYSDSEVLPTTTRKIQITLSNKTLPPGLYWVDLTWDLRGSQTISVEVLEKGAMAVYGKLTGFTMDKNIAQEEDTVKIDAIFENKGEEFIDKAMLNVEIYTMDEKTGKEKKLKEVVKSDPYSASKDATINITSYYTPKDAGKYLLKGYIVYSGKKTRPKQLGLEVLSRPRNYFAQYILLGAVFILASYYLIKRKQTESLDPVTKEFKKDWGRFIKEE